jgi:hybrid cluster-associated redox disulfide protein
MAEEKITEDMNIKEVIDKYPETVSVFAKYNMGCIGCIAASFESLKDIAAVHGTDVKAFVKDLNAAVEQN